MSNNIEQWHWNFGDGNTSDQQYPLSFYSTPGTYQVKLTVIDADQDCKTDAIVVGSGHGDPFKLEVTHIETYSPEAIEIYLNWNSDY
ncbi:MAG: PKD domain-containing protein [Gammaproteobacteria bacterium]|nr:PKD domain-containing protein [Gammaproteobacteria bacterium]